MEMPSLYYWIDLPINLKFIVLGNIKDMNHFVLCYDLSFIKRLLSSNVFLFNLHWTDIDIIIQFVLTQASRKKIYIII